MQETTYAHTFSLRHHWWFDAGLTGLYYIAVHVRDRSSRYDSIKYHIDAHGITFKGSSQDVLKEYFYRCYEELVSRYWNTSTKKQKEDKELVCLNKNTGQIELAAKRNPTPIPSLFTGARSWRADGIPYKELPFEKKQEVDHFLKEHKRKLWGSEELLVYEAPVCHQQIELFPTKGKKNVCCVCGQTSVCGEVSLPSFLLFASPTATLSFNSEGKKPDKICWECEFLSKFAVESAHYKSSDDNLYILQMNVGHAEKNIKSHKILGSQAAVRQLDTDNYRSNIGTQKMDGRLLYYARLPYELLWAFFHDTYELIRDDAEKRAMSANDLFMLCTKPFIEAPIQLVLLTVSSKGKTFIPKEIIAYTDTAYVFRLMHSLREGFAEYKKFLFYVFQDFYLPVKKDKPFDLSNYLWRNHLLQRVLQKKPIVQDVEQLAFRKSLQQAFPYIGNLLEFTRHYQLIIEEGWGMTKEQVEVAVNLGRQIVISAKEAAKDVSDSNFDRVKGDLFTLRKARTVTDFLEQLNRIQFRYNITVSNQILGGILEEPGVSFADFKSYCLLAALNTYNNYKRPKETKELVN